MTAQLTLEHEVSYQMPLSPYDRHELFVEWRRRNPELLEAIETHAIEMWNAGCPRISSKYLIEWARYETRIQSVGVPFRDSEGKLHCYRVCNSDTPALARWLKARHPKMPIFMHKAAIDEMDAA